MNVQGKRIVVAGGGNGVGREIVLQLLKKEEVFDPTDQIIKNHVYVDGLINNAGIIQPFIPLDKLEIERIEREWHMEFQNTLSFGLPNKTQKGME